MQNYVLIKGSDIIGRSYPDINNQSETLRSSFSGLVFPTQPEPLEGQHVFVSGIWYTWCKDTYKRFDESGNIIGTGDGELAWVPDTLIYRDSMGQIGSGPFVRNDAADLNLLIKKGKYIVTSSNTSLNFPNGNLIGDWWLIVETFTDSGGTAENTMILQFAIFHPDSSYRLTRTSSDGGSTWTDWTYTYTQYI